MITDIDKSLEPFGSESLTTSAVRILSFVCVSSINRYITKRDYAAAIEDAETLLEALRALAQRSAK